MPFMAHAFRAGEGAGSGWERPGARSAGTRQDFVGLLLLEVLVRLEKVQQGWDKAQFEKRSGLERQGRGGSGITGVRQGPAALFPVGENHREQSGAAALSASPSVHRVPAIPHRAVEPNCAQRGRFLDAFAFPAGCRELEAGKAQVLGQALSKDAATSLDHGRGFTAGAVPAGQELQPSPHGHEQRQLCHHTIAQTGKNWCPFLRSLCWVSLPRGSKPSLAQPLGVFPRCWRFAHPHLEAAVWEKPPHVMQMCPAWPCPGW